MTPFEDELCQQTQNRCFQKQEHQISSLDEEAYDIDCCHICLEPMFENTKSDNADDSEEVSSSLQELASSRNEKCNHVFHVECITMWLLRTKSLGKCPLCREDYVQLSNKVQ